MRTRWTIQDIEALQKAGKIKGYEVVSKSMTEVITGRRVGKHFKKASPQKDWMGRHLLEWAQERGLVLYEEYNFNPLRRWRADWCIEDLKILVEYEGLMSKKSRHTTSTGFSGDTEKYNSAQALGWKVLRFTALTYENMIDVLNQTEREIKKPRK